MTFYYDSDESTYNQIRSRVRARSFRAQQAASITPEFLAALSKYADAYPTVDPNVTVPLASAGVPAESPEAQMIAQLVAKGMTDDAELLQRLYKRGYRKSSGSALGDLGKAAGTITRPVKRVVSPVVGAVAKAADTALGGIDEALTPAAKASVRVAFAALSSPKQELDNYFRAAAGAFKEIDSVADAARFAASTVPGFHAVDIGDGSLGSQFGRAGSSFAREAILAGQTGSKLDLGEGWIPRGAAEETIRRKAQNLKFSWRGVEFGGDSGMALTPGRLVAATVSEPGTEPFEVLSGLTDAAVAWKLDPANVLGEAFQSAQAGERIARAGRAARDLDAAGVVRGLRDAPDLTSLVGGIVSHRNTILPEVTEAAVLKRLEPVLEKFSTLNSPVEVFEASGRKWPIDLAVRVADNNAEGLGAAGVWDALRPRLGREVADTPEFNGYKVTRAHRYGSTWRNRLPGKHLDFSDPKQAYVDFDLALRTAKLEPEKRFAFLDKFMRSADVREAAAVVMEAADSTAVSLARRVGARRGMDAEQYAKKLTRLFYRTQDEVKRFSIDEIVSDVDAGELLINGQRFDAGRPFLLTELRDGSIPLWDNRQVRRAVSRLGRLVDNEAFDVTERTLAGLMSKWKTFNVARPATFARVVGFTQARLAADGYTSFGRNPIDFIASLMSADSKFARALGSGDLKADVFDVPFDDAGQAIAAKLQAQIQTGANQYRNVPAAGFAGRTMLRPRDPGFEDAWMDVLVELHKDPVARAVAGSGGNLDDAARWFTSGPGQKFRKDLARVHPNLASDAGADAYIEGLWKLVKERTGENPTLMQAVATGKINGESIAQGSGVSFRWGKQFREELQRTRPPREVKALDLSAPALARMSEQADGFVSKFFDIGFRMPNEKLNVLPVFRQTYWQRELPKMLPFMDDPTRAVFLEKAQRALKKSEFDELVRVKPNGLNTVTSVKDADLVLKSRGLDAVEQALYTAAQDSQFFDAFRVVFPFGEAWKEELSRWPRILLNNPGAAYTGQKAVKAAQDSGFFSKSETGDEVFVWWGSRAVSKMLSAVPVDVSSPTSSLQMMTEVLPGIGPAVQIAAGALLPDTPEWDRLRSVLFPYGQPQLDNGILEALVPGYAKSFLQWAGLGDERAFANATMQVFMWKVSNDQIDLTDSVAVQRAFDESKKQARGIYFLRGIGQFALPSSPTPNFLAVVKGDEAAADQLVQQKVIVDDWYKILKASGGDLDAAVTEFLDKWGENNFLLMQSSSTTAAPLVPNSKAASVWERENKDLVRDYPLIWGLFAPDPRAGDENLDYDALRRQYERGERVPLTPDQRLALAQARIGGVLYRRVQEIAGDSPPAAVRQWMADRREEIRAQFPGYGVDIAGLPQKADPETVIAQLERAVLDGRLGSNVNARSAEKYLRARRVALQALPALGLSASAQGLSGEAAAPVRLWLSSIGEQLISDNGNFEPFFNAVFARELL